MTQKQCKQCPWRKDVDPTTIPNGYCAEKHRALTSTIADPADVFSPVFSSKPLRLMACHKSPVGREQPCVGWLHHQLNEGNNITLRLAVRVKRISADYKLVGEQHTCLEDTFPER